MSSYVFVIWCAWLDSGRCPGGHAELGSALTYILGSVLGFAWQQLCLLKGVISEGWFDALEGPSVDLAPAWGQL